MSKVREKIETAAQRRRIMRNDKITKACMDLRNEYPDASTYRITSTVGRRFHLSSVQITRIWRGQS